MKRFFKVVFSILIFSIFFSMMVYVNLDASYRVDLRHYDNVFDEMAQGLRKDTNSKFAKNLGGEVIYKNDGLLKDDGFPSHLHFYSAGNEKGNNNALPAAITYVRVTVDKASDNEPIHIHYYYQLTNKLEVKVDFDYDKQSQTLSEVVTLMNDATKSDLQQALATKGISEREFQSETQKLLGQTVIRAWIGAKDSKSHFSEEEWGNVKISPMIVKEG